ncbi:MAG: Calx-beta domain-containing protein, partial [Pseudomonadota bacterium]|nr:Calx-beta domain-containing protein [Pseudomonadota bacterium]
VVAPGIAAYVEDVSAAESDGRATVPVTLSRASSDDVSLQYQTEAVTAVAGTDYVTSSGTLTVSAGDTSGDISIDIVADTNDEDPETLILRLTAPVNAALGRSSSEITLVDGPVAACQ